MEVALAQEKIWFDKCKYDEAEKNYFEHLAKLPNTGLSKKVILHDMLKANAPRPVSLPVKDDTTLAVSIPDPVAYVPSSEPRIDDKRFKVKNRNKSRKEVEKKVEKTIRQDVKVSSNQGIMKQSLAEEVAKARQHIKSSLECVDGIAKLTTDNFTVEVNNRINTLETENSILKKEVRDLSDLLKKLSDRVAVLEKSGEGSGAAKPASAPIQKPPASVPSKQDDDDDDGVDLFASESEEEDEEANKIKEQRLAAYAAKKSKKPALIAKSNIILDVKPWDDETDMKKMEELVRKVTLDGLLWGASKLVPLAYGIHKLQISCVIEDEKVSVDWLQETLEAIEDYVQSVDVAAFNKV